MNRKKIKMLIVRALTVTCITSTLLGSITTIKASANEMYKTNLLGNIKNSEEVLLDDTFSNTDVDSNADYAKWWENSIKPVNWVLRKWGTPPATVNNTPSGKVVSSESANGGKYVEIKSNNTVGFFQQDAAMNIDNNEQYRLNIKVKTDNISSSEPLTIRAEYLNDADKVVERKDLVKISGTKDWYNEELILKPNTNATKVKIIFIFGNMSQSSKGATGSFAIDSLNIKTINDKLDKIEFENNLIELGIGTSFKPKATLYPSSATEKYNLVSSNENVAFIENGVVFAKSEGSAVIKAISESGKELGAFNVKVNAQKAQEYEKVLNKIFETIVPNSVIDLNDEQTVNAINKLVEKANGYWKNMNKSEDRKSLWTDAASTTSSAHVTTNFNRLYDMAVAYTIKGSQLEGNEALLNDIKDGLEWIVANRYDGKRYYGNWWDWEVGSPQKLNSILILLRDKFTNEEILKYTTVVDTYVKDPTYQSQGTYVTESANRADMCKVTIYSGLLSGKEDRILLGVEKLDPLFKYVEERILEGEGKTDGYYMDGSWVEHNALPYTGSYGAVFIGSVGEIVHVLTDTPWEIQSEKVDKLYNVILDSFEPLMYKGIMMNMVSGRSISRANERDYGHGLGAMRRILAFYTESAPEEYKNRYKSMIKYWIESNDKRDIIGEATNLQFIVQAKALMKDESVKSRGELIGHYNFANMDRVVHRRPGYVLGLSMYSSRIYNYESGNKENLKGYHTADGMTYLYNGDIDQYSDDFWPTVDPKRLAGTTVDTKDIFENVAGLSNGPGQSAKSTRDWVGGASLDNYGVAGMYLDNKRSNPKQYLGMDLEAKKSYFMFDDEIVALGAGITSTEDNGVETIVENRAIDKENDKIYVNGKELTDSIENGTKVNAEWAYLEGAESDENIGYYFPSKTEVNVKRDTRTGKWSDIAGNNQPTKEVTNTFFTMWKDHGKNPSGDTYEYVLLPNKTLEETENYAKNSDIEVIVNSEDVQAVRDNKKGILAANFWNEKEIEIDGLKVDNKASVIMQKENGVLDISVSDPTMKNTGVITVEVQEKLDEVISNNENVEVIANGDSTILKVNVNKASGQSLNAKLKLAEENTTNPDGEDTTNPDGDKNENTDKDETIDSNGEPSKTGDMSSVGMLGSALVLSLMGVAAFRKKK